jgi:hypothetical protein
MPGDQPHVQSLHCFCLRPHLPEADDNNHVHGVPWCLTVQVVSRLGGNLPVFIEATEGPEWEETAEALDDLFLGDAEIW